MRWMATRRARSVGPWRAARIGEIVGIGNDLPLRRLGIEYPAGDAVMLAIGDCLFLAVEAQSHLLARITRTRPSHQGLDLLGSGLLEIEHPELGFGGAGLHRGLGRLVNACCCHRRSVRVGDEST